METLDKIFHEEIERTDKGLKIILRHKGLSYREIFEYLADELLFWNDMYFQIYDNEWLYIEDANYNSVYMVNDYHRDSIKELRDKQETVIPVSSLSYEDYRKEYAKLIA